MFKKLPRGLTIVEVLMLIGIVICIGIMLLPALQSAREKARRPKCIDNMRKLGVCYAIDQTIAA